MEYITSRGFKLPESEQEFADSFWFNLWSIKLWPYQEIVVGDVLYWYESPSKCIVWKSRVIDLDRFPYNNKQNVRDRLGSRFGNFDPNQSYLLEAPGKGYCFAWKVAPLQKVNYPKPDNLRFPMQGWLRINKDIAQNWLSGKEIVDDTILDVIVPKGNLIDRLHNLNKAMEEVSTERVHSIVNQTIRRDTQLIKTLKELCEFRCQFPSCNVKIPKQEGGFYIEVAHIRPVRKGGQSILGNLIVLCPNHHKEFDYGRLEIDIQTVESISGRLNSKEFEIHLIGSASSHNNSVSALEQVQIYNQNH